MTKEENAKRQRIWQRKRKLKTLLAFRWFMEKIRSAKGQRLIKSFLRKIARSSESSPAQALRATEWLIYLEYGAPERPVNPKDIRPVRASEVDPSAPPSSPTLFPSEGDEELETLLKQARGITHAHVSSAEVEGNPDSSSGDVPSV